MSTVYVVRARRVKNGKLQKPVSLAARFDKLEDAEEQLNHYSSVLSFRSLVMWISKEEPS